jgi:hypothetical protein
MSSNDLLYHLSRGEFDDIIDQLVSATRQRLRFLTEGIEEELRTGDVVRFNATVNPKVLVGATATVVRSNSRGIKVRLNESRGKQFPEGLVASVTSTVLEFSR